MGDVMNLDGGVSYALENTQQFWDGTISPSIRANQSSDLGGARTDSERPARA